MAELRITGPEAAAILQGLQAQQLALEARLRRLEEVQAEIYTHRSARGESRAAPLRVALDLRGFRGRVTLEVWLKSSGAADFYVEGSADGTTWRLLDTLTLTGAGERHQGYMNAYPVVRVRTDDVGDHEIEIVAAR